jgi:hypothetical protein
MTTASTSEEKTLDKNDVETDSIFDEYLKAFWAEFQEEIMNDLLPAIPLN